MPYTYLEGKPEWNIDVLKIKNMYEGASSVVSC